MAAVKLWPARVRLRPPRSRQPGRRGVGDVQQRSLTLWRGDRRHRWAHCVVLWGGASFAAYSSINRNARNPDRRSTEVEDEVGKSTPSLTAAPESAGRHLGGRGQYQAGWGVVSLANKNGPYR